MNIFTDEFVNVVNEECQKLGEKESMAKPVLLSKLGLTNDYGPVLALLFKVGRLPEFEISKGRGGGVRRVKVTNGN